MNVPQMAYRIPQIHLPLMPIDIGMNITDSRVDYILSSLRKLLVQCQRLGASMEGLLGWRRPVEVPSEKGIPLMRRLEEGGRTVLRVDVPERLVAHGLRPRVVRIKLAILASEIEVGLPLILIAVLAVTLPGLHLENAREKKNTN